jgi:hypothetical protein
MEGFPVTAFTMLVLAVFPVNAADPVAWGPAVNGLRMSLSVVLDEPPSGRHLQVTIQNIGGNDLLLPLGTINNTKSYADKLKLVLTTADGKHPRVIFTGMPGVISGRLDALVVPLLSGASYTVQMPMDQYYVLEGSENLETFCSGFCQIQVEMETKNVVCSPYGYHNPNMLTCWQDTLPSNAITLDSPVVVEPTGIFLRAISAHSSSLLLETTNDEPRILHFIPRRAGTGQVVGASCENGSANSEYHSFQTGTRLEFRRPGRAIGLGRNPGSF